MRVLIGEEPALQQRVIGELDAGHDVGGEEGHLLRLRVEIVHVAVQNHLTDHPQGDDFFGDQLGGIKGIEVQLRRGLLIEDLQSQLPLGKVAALDRFPQVAPMEVGVGPIESSRPHPTSRDWVPSFGRQWNFTNVDTPLASTSRKVCTPKPSIMR